MGIERLYLFHRPNPVMKNSKFSKCISFKWSRAYFLFMATRVVCSQNLGLFPLIFFLTFLWNLTFVSHSIIPSGFYMDRYLIWTFSLKVSLYRDKFRLGFLPGAPATVKQLIFGGDLSWPWPKIPKLNSCQYLLPL